MTARSYRAADKLMDRLALDEPHILSRSEDSIKCALSYGFAYSDGERSYEEVLTEAEENMYLKKTELKELLNMPER
jgi:GGDEF domain-containing protein